MDIKIVAITGKPNSTLAGFADCVLDVEVEREACPLNLAPTSSTTNSLAIGDALAMVLLEARGFEKENFAQFHPGGSLGHILLTRAEDIMRSGDSLVCVSGEELIRDVVRKMIAARCGAVVITSDDGKLSGIFSQGDFARAFESDNESIGGEQVGDFMTTDPITVFNDQLVGEVLKLLESHRIDDLVVINPDKEPVGIVDTQDLTRIKAV